jgi:hypothetical protein
MNKILQIRNSQWIWYEFRYRPVNIMLPDRYRLVTNKILFHQIEFQLCVSQSPGAKVRERKRMSESETFTNW